jgi:hypothetical protein
MVALIDLTATRSSLGIGIQFKGHSAALWLAQLQYLWQTNWVLDDM